jgi:hypothetical protein
VDAGHSESEPEVLPTAVFREPSHGTFFVDLAGKNTTASVNLYVCLLVSGTNRSTCLFGPLFTLKIVQNKIMLLITHN